MPAQATIKRAKRKARQGKSPSTQAGEFVREEIHHVREGKHGARSAKQAIAIGLSKARRAGVNLPPQPGKEGAQPRRQARSGVSRKRSRATLAALRHEPRSSASHTALARQARKSAARRGASDRHASALKAVRTKGAEGRKRAAQKAAATRAHLH
jgi:hypothetical protein